MMNENKNKDQWLHQMMQDHRKGLDVNLEKSHDAFTCKVMNQLPEREPIMEGFWGTKSFWNNLLCICLISLIGIAWVNGTITSVLADGTWFSGLTFRLKQILNIVLQLNPRSNLNINKGMLLLTSLPWMKYIVLVSVMLSIAIFEWHCPSCLKKNKHCF